MSYGMQYTAVAASAASPATATFDLLEITAPADCIVVLTSLYIGQESDFGDAAAEGIKVQIIKGYTTSGSGGSSVTPTKLQTGFAAAGSTVESHNTTVANTGTPVTLHEDIMNVQIGYQWRPAPNECIILSPSERVVVRISGQADSVDIAATLNFTEIGG